MPDLTIEEFYKHIEATAGEPIQGQKRAKTVQDPLVQLDKPLQAYPNRIFFYVGLLYGFCRLDASITERFREDAGRDVPTQLHLVDKPIVTVRGFPGFANTRVAHMLQSCQAGQQADLFDYIASQVVVDRARQRVWKIAMTTCQVPDPYAATQVVSGYSLVIFYPQTHDFEYRPVASTGLLLHAPEVQHFERSDSAFKLDTDKYLARKD
jgi:hypothetical protein